MPCDIYANLSGVLPEELMQGRFGAIGCAKHSSRIGDMYLRTIYAQDTKFQQLKDCNLSKGKLVSGKNRISQQ